MRAVTFQHFGGPDVLQFTDIPTPKPSAEQLLVHVKATALNRADLLQRRGKYPPPPGESDILGLEIAGEVAATGNHVTDFKVGDRVFGIVGSGGYADYCLIDQGSAMIIPDNLTYTEAAAIPEAFLTANEAIFTLGNLQPNESILIHAGGSGVGSAGIQLATLSNAVVYTTAGSPDKIQKIDHLFHPKAILNYKENDFSAEIQKITQHHGVDVLIDFIGASYLTNNMRSLAVGGRLICVGLMGGRKAEINLDYLLTHRLQIKGLVMRIRSTADKRAITARFKERWLPLLAAGKIKPVIDSVYPIERVQAAHEHMENQGNFGKIVLEMG